MRIRLTGSEHHVRIAATLIGRVLTVRSVSRFCPDPLGVHSGRLYLDTDNPATPATPEGSIRNDEC